MFSLVFLVFVGGCLLFAFIVVRLAQRYARWTDRDSKKWGWGAALILYLLLAWEQIPTYVVHKFLCFTKAGLHVYVTPEQWDKENPGAMDALVFSNELSRSERLADGTKRYHTTERLVWDVSRTRIFLLPVTLNEYAVVDMQDGTVLAKSISVGSGYGNPSVGGANSWRFWVGSEGCGPKLGAEKRAYREYWRKRNAD